jgi:hypothetical protein
MNAQTAETVLYSITAGAAVIWAIGLLFVWRSRGGDAGEPAAETATDFGEADPSERTFSGTAMVESDSPDLPQKAARLLAEGKLGVPLKIVHCDEREVVFEPVIVSRWFRLRRGILRFDRAGSGRTRISYSMVGQKSARGLLWLAWLFQGLGLLAIAIGFSLISTHVVHHENPSVRIQSVQMVQVIHFLWPPFLFAGLHRKFSRLLRHLSERLLDALAHNLPYVG